LRPAIASHNVRSLAHAIALREAMGIGRSEVEGVQLLHGMADPLERALVTLGERVRVYCPVGELLPGIAYLVRRLLENTSNQGFVRAGYLERQDPEVPLQAPAPETGFLATEPPALETTAKETLKGARLAGFSNDPPADFSRHEDRELMQAALGRLEPVVVGDKSDSDARWLVSLDPCDNRCEVGRVRVATASDANFAMDRAALGLEEWRGSTGGGG